MIGQIHQNSLQQLEYGHYYLSSYLAQSYATLQHSNSCPHYKKLPTKLFIIPLNTHYKIMKIIRFPLVSIALMIHLILYTNNPIDCLWNGATIYNNFNLTQPGLPCKSGNCFPTICATLNATNNEIAIVLNSQTPIPRLTVKDIPWIMQIFTLTGLFIYEIVQLFIKIRHTKPHNRI